MIQVLIDNIDRTAEIIFNSLSVSQAITNSVDTATFSIRKYGDRTYTPTMGEEVKIYDGATQIFGGNIKKVNESLETSEGIKYNIQCSDYTAEMNKLLVARRYENKTIKEIITEMLADYAPAFNADNVMSNFLIDNIVFNQIPVSQCIKRLSDLVKYEWYVDENKSVYFFQINDLPAPYNLTDTSGNFVSHSLGRNLDGSQIVNRVKVRGGEYDGLLFTDSITVSGDDTKSFILPYKFSNLAIKLNGVTKIVGLDNLDSFPTVDVLFNFQEKTFRFDTALTAGDVIEFSGNPKVRVFAVAEDPNSIALYGRVEKLIREDDIESNAVARQRAVAELYAFASEVIDASFTTRTPGLKTGMTINLSSVKKGYDDNLVIKGITFKPIDKDNFGYQVSCISGKRYDLVQVLAKLLAPKTLKIDETEIAEDIFIDQYDLSITEEHQVILPVLDDGSIEIEENIIVSDTEPTWVLAHYTPTSQADPKRQGRLDLSMKLY